MERKFVQLSRYGVKKYIFFGGLTFFYTLVYDKIRTI